MQLNVNNDSSKAIEVANEVFQVDFNEPLIHQVVTAFQAGGRAGTKAQKTRAEVRGGGKKPWKQKGTGRARAGSSRSPLWRAGGKTFAAKTRSFEQKVNRKMYHGAMRSMISELIRLGRVQIIDAITLEEPKTKALLTKMAGWNVDRALIVVDQLDENLYLSSRNLIGTEAIDAIELNPLDLVAFEHLVITVPALRMIEERLS